MTLTETPQAPESDVSTNDFPYRFEIVSIQSMIVDDAYQRPLTSFHKKIAEEWDPALVGCLVLSDRGDGTYATVDGWTRRSAAALKGLDALPGLVYMGLSVKDEASLFARLQKNRKGIATFVRFRAAMVAGDEEPIAIAKIVRSTGYEVGINGKEPGEITAVAALERAYRRSPEVLERTLLILREAWGEKHLPAAEHIRGLALILDTEDEADVDDEKLAEKLGKVSPNDLKIAAVHLREGTGGGSSEKHMAGAIMGVYKRR